MEKIKLFLTSEQGKDILIVLIVIFVGLSSFYLGRLSKEAQNNGIKVEYNGQEAAILNALGQNGPNLGPNGPSSGIPQNSSKNAKGEYFASSRGKKYYSIGCSAGKSIKSENRIYFATAADAERAGYELSGSCQ